MPREEDEFALSYYNSMTTWIDIDQLLDAFSLTRDDLPDADKVSARVRELGAFGLCTDDPEAIMRGLGS